MKRRVRRRCSTLSVDVMIRDPKAFSAAFKETLPVLMGYSTMGMAFGILLVKEAHLNWLWAGLCSVSILSGSLQFAAVEMLRDAIPLWQVALLSLLINIRYCVYGLPLIDDFRRCGALKYYLIGMLSDETYAIQVQDRRPPEADRRKFLFYVAALDHFYWVFGSVTGALIGGVLPWDMRGVDFAMTALFLVILTDQCREKRQRIPAAIGLTATIIARLVCGESHMLPAAMLMMIATLLLLRPKLSALYPDEVTAS